MRAEDSETSYLANGREDVDLEAFRTIDASEDLLTRFWEHQYERLSQSEKDRLAFTNIIVGASVVALAVLVDNGSPERSAGTLAAFLGIAAANLMAIGYLYRTKEHVAQSLSRARTALRALSPDLFALQQATSAPVRRIHSINNYQTGLHALLLAASSGAALTSTI